MPLEEVRRRVQGPSQQRKQCGQGGPPVDALRERTKASTETLWFRRRAPGKLAKLSGKLKTLCFCVCFEHPGMTALGPPRSRKVTHGAVCNPDCMVLAAPT